MTIKNFKNYAFVGLGSNLSGSFSSPKDNVLGAIERIKKLSDEAILFSSLLESKPLDCPPGSPDFINAVAAFLPRQNETSLSLLHELQNIENSLGRTRSGLKNEARIIDLDLLIFKEESLQSEELKLPHPGILNRDFVQLPLQELLGEDAYKSLITFIKNL
ncbi:2-amino-4-hydroxy-6-hydroxymethyldihydropteridine diphosphokinase [Gammaproteobacteria bacterium]|jgi:2-amino-4-hydroxy-6-hydroxymethyldihydropteridine diphosphokinase|nr:2-amino-4-hydroxy-6-hydroxymethyldihydropteridine diphosphokinase [Gammaproteobacteria bacterium]